MLQGELDHILWAVPDLEAGMAEMEKRIGIAPQVGGRHPGVGTHNALLSMGEKSYLEVIAPDPTQDRFSSFGTLIKGIDKPRLVTWAARTRDARKLAEQAKQQGLLPGVVLALSRRRPDGTSVSWRTLTIGGHPYGPLVPFFIEWRSDEHPADISPVGCKLIDFSLESPDPQGLGFVLAGLGLELPISEAPKARLKAVLDTPKGRITLG